VESVTLEEIASRSLRKRSGTRIYRDHPAAPNIHALGTAALANIQPDRRDNDR
jgi:hypothetical protein